MKPVHSLLIIAVLLVLTACSSSPAPSPSGSSQTIPTAVVSQPATEQPTVDPNAPKPGGTLIFGTPQEPAILNTLLTTSSIEDAVTSLFVEGLVQVNDKGEYVPVLAEELPTVSEDGLVVTWKLRKGVKFSNGLEFTCEDVKFTMEGALSDLSQVSTSGYSSIETLECPDPYTVVATFSEVYAPYLRLFAYIVPMMPALSIRWKPGHTIRNRGERGLSSLKNGLLAIISHLYEIHTIVKKESRTWIKSLFASYHHEKWAFNC